jgi:macrolide transport system ATP-binding/permease protein
MSYLSISNISKTYGFHTILNQVSFVLNAGERVGLVGANGVGKSTLLKIVTGEVEADGGSITVSPGMELSYLPQTITGYDDQSVDDLIAASMRHLHDLESRMRDLEGQMSQLNGEALDRVMNKYGDVMEQFERHGGYDIGYRVETILNGLGIGHINRNRRFGTLSGGEKARVGLAILLLGQADVLLLDEPTNHLDLTSLEWLENYLSAYPGAILMVSHDRQFLNRTVNAIIELDEHSRSAKRYSGDYDSYQTAKVKERLKWEADWAEQQEEIKALKLEIHVTARKNTYRAASDNDKFVLGIKKNTHADTISKKVRAAEEKLKRIEADPIPQPPAPLRFNPDFDPQALKGRMPMVASGLSKAYGTRNILHDVSFTVGVHSRIVLVGPNGAGKSTLLKILLKREAADSGEVTINPAVRVGYLSQEQDTLDPAKTLFEAYREGLPEADQQLKATLIKSGLFRYDDFGKLVGQLSSGQRRKLQIARLIAGRANLLVLDEPTNDVSFDVLEALETALHDFPGPVIAASHDRRFMQQFGGEVWEMREGEVIQHLGGHEQYMGESAEYGAKYEVLGAR